MLTEVGAGKHQGATHLKLLVFVFVFVLKLEWIAVSSSRGSS